MSLNLGWHGKIGATEKKLKPNKSERDGKGDGIRRIKITIYPENW